MKPANLLLRRVQVSFETSTSVLNTIRLGTHLFNPHRFEAVLKAVRTDPINDRFIDISGEFEDYLMAGTKCFRHSSNLRLIAIEQIVNVLQILKYDFPDSKDIYNTIVTSLANSIDTDTRLSQLESCLRKSQLDEPVLADTLLRRQSLAKPRSKARINLAYLNQNPAQYLDAFLDMSEQELVAAGLTEMDIARILVVCRNSLASSIQERLVSAISILLRARIERLSPNVTDKLGLLTVILSLGSLEHAGSQLTCVLERCASEILPDTADILSPSQAVDLAYVFPSGSFSKSTLRNLFWRIERDPMYLSSLDTVHCLRLLKTLRRFEGDQIYPVEALVPSITKNSAFSRTSEVVELICTVSEFGWVESPHLTDAVFRKVFDVGHGLQRTDSCAQEQLLVTLLRVLDVTDEKLIPPLMDKFIFDKAMDRLDMCDRLIETVKQNLERSESRIGNVILSKMMAKNSTGFTKILDSVSRTGSIPLRCKLTELSINQLQELAEVATQKASHHSNNAELICDAASSQSFQSAAEIVPLFRLLSKMGYQCRAMHEFLSKRFADLKYPESHQFLSACASLRMGPGCTVTQTEIQSGFSADAIVSLTCSISSLGILQKTGLVKALIDRFLIAIKTADTPDGLASKFLCSLFISLHVPSRVSLGSLLDLISSGSSSPSTFESEVFAEIGSILGNRQLASWYPGTVPISSQETIGAEESKEFACRMRVGETNLSVVDRIEQSDIAVMIARPEDCYMDNTLTQLFKFKLFLVKQRVPKVHVLLWNHLH